MEKNLSGLGLHRFDLHQLPPEILVEIVSYLQPTDLIKVSLVCKSLYEAVQVQRVWELRTITDFGIRLEPLRKFEEQNAKCFYQKILWPFGRLLGLWQRQNFSNYGNLTQVLFDGSECWKLRIITWDPPPDPKVHKPMRSRDFLTIQLDLSGQKAEIIVNDEFVKTDKCQVLIQDDDTFQIKLQDCPDWLEEPILWNRHLAEFLHRQTGRHSQARNSAEFLLQMDKYVRLFHLRKDYLFNRVRLQRMEDIGLEMQRPSLPEILKPGVFKGTYGPHGIELINVTYQKNPSHEGTLILEGTKLTGDPNVPFREVSFRADLSKPVFYTNVEDQIDISTLMNVENLPVIGADVSVVEMRQVFQLPRTWYHRGVKNFTHCLGRYKAECQVAGIDHSNPELIAGHFVVISEDLFGVLFLELHTFSVYQRVTENLQAFSFKDIYKNN